MQCLLHPFIFAESEGFEPHCSNSSLERSSHRKSPKIAVTEQVTAIWLLKRKKTGTNAEQNFSAVILGSKKMSTLAFVGTEIAMTK